MDILNLCESDIYLTNTNKLIIIDIEKYVEFYKMLSDITASSTSNVKLNSTILNSKNFTLIDLSCVSEYTKFIKGEGKYIDEYIKYKLSLNYNRDNFRNMVGEIIFKELKNNFSDNLLMYPEIDTNKLLKNFVQFDFSEAITSHTIIDEYIKVFPNTTFFVIMSNELKNIKEYSNLYDDIKKYSNVYIFEILAENSKLELNDNLIVLKNECIQVLAKEFVKFAIESWDDLTMYSNDKDDIKNFVLNNLLFIIKGRNIKIDEEYIKKYMKMYKCLENDINLFDDKKGTILKNNT